MKFKPLTTAVEWCWIYERAYPVFGEDTQGIVAYDERGIQAVVVADTFTRNGCNVHFAIENPMAIRAGLIHEGARHLFDTCGRDHLVGMVPSNNTKSNRIVRHLGFVQVGTIPNGQSEGVDTNIYQITREQAARWLEPMREAA